MALHHHLPDVVQNRLRDLKARITTELNIRPSKESARIAGRDYKFYPGTVERADKDTAWLRALLAHTNALCDVGSNVGQTAVAASLLGVKDVFVIDATADALALCVENLTSNFPGKAFRAALCFVSDSDEGATDLHVLGTGAANSMYAAHAVTAAARGHVVGVPNRTIDNLVDEASFDPDLIKIDIEGAEAIALAGASRVARRKKARFFVEMHASGALPMTDNIERVLAWTRSVDYSAYYLAEHVRLDDAAPAAHRGRCHLLLLPSAHPYPDYLRSIAEGAPVHWPS